MKKLILLALMGLYSLSGFAALHCEQIEKKQDEDGNISYFSEVEGIKVSSATQKKLLRAAVANFYGECGISWNKEYCYKAKMTHKEVVELGEDAYFLAYKTPAQELYYAVNVGFGGGNSALYFFTSEELKMEKVMIIDGAECSPIQSILGYN